MDIPALSAAVREAEEAVRTSRAELHEVVREAHAEGASVREIAGLLGISRQRVNRLVRDEQYRAAYLRNHAWVNSNASKTGTCQDCGEETETEWSNVDHEYRAVREDWRELCRPCHRAADRRLVPGG